MKDLGAASRCNCPERAGCEDRWCDQPADWSVWQPRWGARAESFAFMCDMHKRYFVRAHMMQMKGIDRAESSSEDWRGSILDHLRHASIAISFRERDRREACASDQMDAWKRGLRKMREQRS
jgi:hypothetical protein